MTGKIAIVGAGPSGCYVAQSLLKAAPALEVDVLDSLPVPFGLIRYGVAADHQGTKAVARQFERVFDRQGARFFGNVALGRDVSLDALRAGYDAVVLALGLPGDRRLAVPGDDHRLVFGAGALTRALSEHPDAGALPAIGADPLIVGNGNVAIDLLRLLSKSPAELAGSDLGEGPSAWLEAQEIRYITIVGRSPAASAKFDPAMIRELSRLAQVSIEVEGAGPMLASGDPRLQALGSLHGHGSGPRRLLFRFGLRPVAVEDAQAGLAMRFAGADGIRTLGCSALLTAIGFQAGGGIDRDALLREATALEDGRLAEGLFAAGWFRCGPTGAIPDSRADAQTVAAAVLRTLRPDPAKTGRAGLSAIEGIVGFEGWKRIDSQERAGAGPDRCRRKFSSRTALLRAAATEECAP